jgi:NAD(P)-dependent dehydrogenase (short-subunit alcohol dehydrogenase family)
VSSYDLEGATAVITGAAGGLGTAIAESFAAAGARLALLDLRPATETAAAIAERHGTTPLLVEADVGDAAQMRAAALAVESDLGPVHVLVNNAAIYKRAPLEEHTVELWDATLGVNLRGYFLGTLEFGRGMLACGRGAIVNISSIAARGPTPNAAAYCASKAAVLALTRQTALEWSPRGIRANAVSPGFLNTSMASVSYDAQDDLTAQRRDRVPVRRIAEPSEVARVVRFLASDASSYVNGEEIVVDGGLTQTLSETFPRPPLVQTPERRTDG